MGTLLSPVTKVVRKAFFGEKLGGKIIMKLNHQIYCFVMRLGVRFMNNAFFNSGAFD